MQRRLLLMLSWHRKGQLGEACDCSAFNEGQTCCVEALYDDEAWQRLTGGEPARQEPVSTPWMISGPA